MTILDVIVWIWDELVDTFYDALAWLEEVLHDDEPLTYGHDAAGDEIEDRM